MELKADKLNRSVPFQQFITFGVLEGMSIGDEVNSVEFGSKQSIGG